MRFAARPVGAASTADSFKSSKSARTVVIIVVLPVPGPPVTTAAELDRQSLTALFCSGASVMPRSCSMRAMRSSASSSVIVYFGAVTDIDKSRRAT